MYETLPKIHVFSLPSIVFIYFWDGGWESLLKVGDSTQKSIAFITLRGSNEIICIRGKGTGAKKKKNHYPQPDSGD